MSKKSKKRQSRKKRTTSSSVNDATVNSEHTKTYNSGFDPDYSQTIKDLKRIGILAGTFIAFLVVLSFFLG
jgi:Rod binding domain-containing protein